MTGVLLGTALGDALGLPAEGMSASQIARRFGRLDRFRLLGSTGFVSDDTEQAALAAECLLRYPNDRDAFVAAFRRALRAWFWRLPWGVGLATVKACLRITLGIRPSGVPSAGNGAAMRAAVVGAVFSHDPQAREQFGRALATVTHTDPRAVAGALFVAELTAHLITGSEPRLAAQQSIETVEEPALRERLDAALALHASEVGLHPAAEQLGASGYVLHTVPFALFAFLRMPHHPLDCLVDGVSAGGDTDSIGAIVGAWLGAWHGERGLPAELVNRIHNGPFGPSHLRALANAICAQQAGGAVAIPRFSGAAAMARNLALYPVILAHGFRRLLP